MGLLESFRKHREEQKAGTPKGWVLYREILSRADNPKAGDVQKLAELIEGLGLDPRQPEADLLVLRELQQQTEAAASRTELLAQKEKLEHEARELSLKLSPLIKQRDAIWKRLEAMQPEVARAETAADMLAQLNASFPKLLRGAVDEAPTADYNVNGIGFAFKERGILTEREQWDRAHPPIPVKRERNVRGLCRVSPSAEDRAMMGSDVQSLL